MFENVFIPATCIRDLYPRVQHLMAQRVQGFALLFVSLNRRQKRSENQGRRRRCGICACSSTDYQTTGKPRSNLQHNSLATKIKNTSVCNGGCHCSTTQIPLSISSISLRKTQPRASPIEVSTSFPPFPLSLICNFC